MVNIAIIGAGGFAREVAWLIRDINHAEPTFNIVTHLVSDVAKVDDPFAEHLSIQDFTWLEANQKRVDTLVMGIGTPSTKFRLATELQGRFPHMGWPTLIHPTVQFEQASTRFGKGVVMCAGSIATVNTTFDDFAMVNLNCTIGHEVCIGAYAVLNPGVNISGGVQIGEEALIGTGAQILQNLSVGAKATVGAGSVVTKNVPQDQTVVGIPAKALSRG